MPQTPQNMIDLSNPEAIIAEARRREARRAQGLPINPTPGELEQERAQRLKEDDDRLEREIQAEVVRIYRANGCTVYEGLKEKRKTRIQPGQPDLTVFHSGKGAFWFHEVKTPTGQLRPDQVDFRNTCMATGVPHYVGGVETAELALNEQVRSK